MSKTVLVTALSFSRYSREPQRILEGAGFQLIRNQEGRPLKEAELVDRIKGVDALIVGVDPVTEKVIEAADKLRIICKHGVGVDNIDLKAAARRGIMVTNAPDSNYISVADLTFGLLLAAARQIPHADIITKNGKWDRVVGREVWKKTLGIIGTGRIGLAVARRAQGFEMKILAYDKFPNNRAAQEIGFTYVSLEKLLSESDFVSLHVPLTEETRHLINEKTIDLMKPEAILINTARGELVDEKALYLALKEGRLAGAALDAYAEEPPSNNMLLSLSQVVTTPHIGAYTYEANHRMGCTAAESIVKFFAGNTPDYVVVG
ncbi:phosphoglycerate dehydrogenase [Calderihabitans maritimus]|uniref:Glyoxylate reductase n=1 Tax=Calderihabitans maritimus TaxID=1246530 RepID=A0A1Z5HRK1_9FIRM|nr:phosphoglycerate dehydrogenase [Calderihabitans maritimus]GAW91945.1 Glyoxylate reductase [Calderihabitans maritimus]